MQSSNATSDLLAGDYHHEEPSPRFPAAATSGTTSAPANATVVEPGTPSGMSSIPSTGITAPIVDTTLMSVPSTGMTAPIRDTTFPLSSIGSASGFVGYSQGSYPPVQSGASFPKPKGSTRIEGMEALNITLEKDDMTESEKRMKEEEISFYSASDNEHGDDNVWGLLSGVGGNIYEW